jgi:hypothetical protein
MLLDMGLVFSHVLERFIFDNGRLSILENGMHRLVFAHALVILLLTMGNKLFFAEVGRLSKLDNESTKLFSLMLEVEIQI